MRTDLLTAKFESAFYVRLQTLLQKPEYKYLTPMGYHLAYLENSTQFSAVYIFKKLLSNSLSLEDVGHPTHYEQLNQGYTQLKETDPVIKGLSTALELCRINREYRCNACRVGFVNALASYIECRDAPPYEGTARSPESLDEIKAILDKDPLITQYRMEKLLGVNQ